MLELFQKDTKWQRLRLEVLQELCGRLESIAQALELKSLAEATGLLENNFLPLASRSEVTGLYSEPEFVVDMFAAALTSAASCHGQRGDLDIAKKLAGFAIRISCFHTPAYMAMVACCMADGNVSEAMRWCNRGQEALKSLMAIPDDELCLSLRALRMQISLNDAQEEFNRMAKDIANCAGK
ncbi:MAG TPA: hypothetical protein VM219_01360 [Phycisphaerae bacterium]|nr:hypothetical protein [Phycisphaerae bacterium]